MRRFNAFFAAAQLAPTEHELAGRILGSGRAKIDETDDLGRMQTRYEIVAIVRELNGDVRVAGRRWYRLAEVTLDPGWEKDIGWAEPILEQALARMSPETLLAALAWAVDAIENVPQQVARAAREGAVS